MGTPQISYSQNPVAGRSGQMSDFAQGYCQTVIIAEALGIEPGRLMVRDVNGEAVLPLGQATDADAVIATGASSAALQTISGASLDGVVGGDWIPVPAKVTLTLSNSTDWDSTNATLTAINDEGTQVTELLAIPDGGNATVTSTGRYQQVVSLAIPAQTGAGGTFTLGFLASDGALAGAQILGVAHLDPTQEPPLTLAVDKAHGAVRKGRVWVATDTEVSAGARAYVRVFAGVGESVGIFRDNADTADALVVTGARFVRVASATLAELEVDFVS